MLSYVVVYGNAFAQWQVLVGLLFLVSNILYNRTCGRSIWVWVAKDDPPEGGGNCIHICYASDVVFHDMTGANTGHSWGKPHGHGTYGYFWCFQTSRHPFKTVWQGGRLYRCYHFCRWRGFGWRRYFWKTDGRLHRFYLGTRAGSSSQSGSLGWLRGLPSGNYWLRWMQYLIPSNKPCGTFLGLWFWYEGCLWNVGRGRGC